MNPFLWVAVQFFNRRKVGKMDARDPAFHYKFRARLIVYPCIALLSIILD